MAIEIPFELPGAERAKLTLRELKNEFTGTQRAVIDLAAKSEQGKKAFDELTEGLEKGVVSAGEVRESLAKLAAQAPKSASEVKKAADEAAKALENEARAARDAAKDQAKAAREASNAAKEHAKTVKEEGKAFEEAYGKMRERAERFASSHKTATTSNESFATSLFKSQVAANLTTAAYEKLLETVVEFLRTIPEGAAASERHAQALESLGPAYDTVQRATRGSVSAEQAWQVQQKLTESGLRVTAQELAAITQRAREYARATGTETTQALDQLTDALRQGGGEEIRKFGITVQTGLTRTEGFTSAIRQLSEQTASSAPPVLTLAEAHERYARASELAKSSLQGLIAEKLNLKDFFDQTASWLEETTRATNGWDRALEALRGTITEAAGAGSTTARTDGQASSFGARYGAAIDELRRAGVDTRQYPMAGQLINLSADEQSRVLAIVQRDLAQRRGQGGQRRDNLRGAAQMFRQDVPEGPTLGGEGPSESSAQAITNLGASATGRAETVRRTEEKRRRVEEERRERERRAAIARELAAQVAPVDADAVRRAQVEYEQAQLEAQGAGVGGVLGASGRARTPDEVRQRRLDVLRQSATETDARRGENEVSRLQRLTAATREYITTLQRYREEDGRLETQIRAAAQAEKDRIDTIAEGLRLGGDATRRRNIETLGLADEELQVRRQMDAATNPGGRGDARRQRERMADLVELRSAYQNLLEQTDSRLAQARAEGRDQSEVNTLLQERLGLLRSLAGATQELTAIQREQSAATTEFKDQMTGALGGVAQGFADAAVASLDSGEDFKYALGDMLREQAKQLAKMSIFKFLENTALGLAALAGFMPGSAANYFAAAGMWAALGGITGAAVYATRPPDRSNEKEKGTSRSSTDRVGAARADTGGGGGPLVLNINVSGALFNDGVTEAVAREVRRAQAQNLLRS